MNDLQDLKTIQCPLDGVGFWKVCVDYMYECIDNPENHTNEEYPPKGMTDEMVFKANVIAGALAEYFVRRRKDVGFEALGVIDTRLLLSVLAHNYTRYVRQYVFEHRWDLGSQTAFVRWAARVADTPEVWVFSCEDLTGCGVHDQDSVQEREMLKEVERQWGWYHNNLRNPPESPPMEYIRNAIKVIHEIGIDDFMREGPYDY